MAGSCGAWLAAAEFCFATSVAEAAAAAVVFAALVRLAKLGNAGGGGVPTAVPATEMLEAFNTTCAAIFRLPDERMPASPASTVPAGAIKSTSPGGTPTRVASTPMPEPVARP